MSTGKGNDSHLLSARTFPLSLSLSDNNLDTPILHIELPSIKTFLGVPGILFIHLTTEQAKTGQHLAPQDTWERGLCFLVPV